MESISFFSGQGLYRFTDCMRILKNHYYLYGVS
jgi:hypothetical protein